MINLHNFLACVASIFIVAEWNRITKQINMNINSHRKRTFHITTLKVPNSVLVFVGMYAVYAWYVSVGTAQVLHFFVIRINELTILPFKNKLINLLWWESIDHSKWMLELVVDTHYNYYFLKWNKIIFAIQLGIFVYTFVEEKLCFGLPTIQLSLPGMVTLFNFSYNVLYFD